MMFVDLRPAHEEKPGGCVAALGSCDRRVRLWDAATRACLSVYYSVSGAPRPAADSRVIAAGTGGRVEFPTPERVKADPPSTTTPRLWIRLYRSGLSEMMDKMAQPSIRFFSPYERAAQDLTDCLGSGV